MRDLIRKDQDRQRLRALPLEGAPSRAMPVRRFPYLVFCRDAADLLETWRIQHMQRDLPRSLGDLPEA